MHLSGIGWYHLSWGNQFPNDRISMEIHDIKRMNIVDLITAVSSMIKVVSVSKRKKSLYRKAIIFFSQVAMSSSFVHLSNSFQGCPLPAS